MAKPSRCELENATNSDGGNLKCGSWLGIIDKSVSG